MNYKKHYDLLIENTINRTLSKETYIEKHHIIPKCMGGSNNKTNIVKLTAREHYVIHWLLIKIHPKHKGLIFALNMMIHTNKDNRKLKITSKEYEIIRILHSKNISNLFKGKPSHKKGKKSSKETCKKISEATKGEKNPMWGRKGKDSPNTGKKHTKEECKRRSERQKGEKSYWWGKKGKEHPSYNTKCSDKIKLSIRKNNPNCKPIIINEIWYQSIRDASRKLNIHRCTIRDRLKSPNFPNYQYI
jgi:hypothetical protein